MPLPNFDKNKSIIEPIIPIFESLFEVRSPELSIEILENIFSYNINIINKTISLDLNLYVDLLCQLDDIVVDKIEVCHHNIKGEILFKRIVKELTYLGYSTKADYNNSNDLLNCVVSWKFEEIYNKHA